MSAATQWKICEQMEKLLALWMEDQNIPLGQATICNKAKSTYDEMKYKEEKVKHLQVVSAGLQVIRDAQSVTVLR